MCIRDSVYAMVTLYTALDEKKRKGVRRAVGLTHIALDRSSQTLNLALDMDERVKPRTIIEVPITITGGKKTNKAWVSLAAVDEGILALTDFDSPDAPGAFFSKKAFALDIHDDYSRLLNPYAANGPIRSGGDSIGGAGLSVVPTQTVALFEGPIAIKNGKAVVSFELPDFNGELRLMAGLDEDSHRQRLTTLKSSRCRPRKPCSTEISRAGRSSGCDLITRQY